MDRAAAARATWQDAISLPVVQFFWHGSPLRRMQRLALRSFVANGHRVHLYAYDDVGNPPPGVELRDAHHVLPREALFRHARTGSLAVFSDWFRYRLLYERGGIWCDADMVCLRPFAFASDIVFGWATKRSLAAGVIGLPPHHKMAALLCDYCENPARWQPYDSWLTRARKLRRRFLHGSSPTRFRYGETGPHALTRVVRHLRLAQHALPVHCFYGIPLERWRDAFNGVLGPGSAEIAGSLALHLSHEMLRRDPHFDPEGVFAGDSLFEYLCRRYGV